MIPLLGRREAAALDQAAVAQLGLPSMVLMENAGRGALDRLSQRFASALDRVVIVCGPGQNGGDGFVIARHLLNEGHGQRRPPRVLLLADPVRLRGDAAQQHAALLAMGKPPERITDPGELTQALVGASLVIDALFGTGLDRAPTGLMQAAIEAMNACAAPKVALDLPSGVDADTGAVLGVAVRASLTVTFAAPKRGLFQHPGAGHAGDVEIAPIGIAVPSTPHAAGVIEAQDVNTAVPRRAADEHKGGAGHVLVIAGGPGRFGAAVLSGLGALRAGAGLVTLAGRGLAGASVASSVPELMTLELPVEPSRAIEAALRASEGKRAVVIGPGFGTDDAARGILRELCVRLPLPCVIDADALTALSTELGMLERALGPRVLTPHPGEAGRLLGLDAARVQADRYAAASRIARETSAVTVLKGALSLVSSPDGALRVCPRGTPAMATAGSGDVLAGATGALLATLDPFVAAQAATYLHGLAGELAGHLAGVADRGLLASDIAHALPAALARCRA